MLLTVQKIELQLSLSRSLLPTACCLFGAFAYRLARSATGVTSMQTQEENQEHAQLIRITAVVYNWPQARGQSLGAKDCNFKLYRVGRELGGAPRGN